MLDKLETQYKREGQGSSQNLSVIGRARADFGGKKAAELTADNFAAYIEKRLADGARPATVNRTTQVVQQAYKVGDVPAPKIRHLSEKDNVRHGFLSEPEFLALLGNLPTWLQDFTLLGYLTGWRKGEIASLRWEDVEGGLVRLRGENSKNGEPRAIVLAGELASIIERRRALRAVQTPQGVVLCEWVFHRCGEPIRQFRKSWARACKLAGCPGKLFHDLRRTAVRNLVRSGVPETVAMSVSGHKTRAVFDRYNITSEKDLRDAMLSVQKYREAQAEKVVAISLAQ